MWPCSPWSPWKQGCFRRSLFILFILCDPSYSTYKLHQHRPQTATSIFPGKWSAIPRIFVPPYNLFFWGKKEKKSGETNPGSLAGTRRNQEIKMEQNPCPEGKRNRETSPGTQAGTRRNQEIMMEKHPFPEERKKRKVGWQAPDQKEPGRWKNIPFLRQGARKSWWREKQEDKPRNLRKNQKEPGNHNWTQSLCWENREK